MTVETLLKLLAKVPVHYEVSICAEGACSPAESVSVSTAEESNKHYEEMLKTNSPPFAKPNYKDTVFIEAD